MVCEEVQAADALVVCRQMYGDAGSLELKFELARGAHWGTSTPGLVADALETRCDCDYVRWLGLWY